MEISQETSENLSLTLESYQFLLRKLINLCEHCLEPCLRLHVNLLEANADCLASYTESLRT